MRFSVESWSPEYGSAIEGEALDDVSEHVDATIERALADWAPITPAATARPTGSCSSTASAASTPACGSTTATGPTRASARRWPPASSSARPRRRR